MNEISAWVMGIFIAVLGLTGLFLASGASGPVYWSGLGVAVFAVVFDIWLIKGCFDRAEQGGAAD
jgi:hypothetical protein